MFVALVRAFLNDQFRTHLGPHDPELMNTPREIGNTHSLPANAPAVSDR